MSAQPHDVIEGTAIVVRDEERPAIHYYDLSPQERSARQTAIANEAKAIIDSRGWYVEIQGKRHVEVQGWQVIAALVGCCAKVVSTAKLDDDVEGYEARAVVVRVDSGIEVSAGDGMCARDEARWKRAEKYAIRSMAQTRACSRAIQHAFRFVAELAGYSGTPAEEVPPGGFADVGRSDGAKNVTPLRRGRDERKQVPIADLRALAEECGIPSLGEWLEENVAPGLSQRKPKIVTPAESIEAERQLRELLAALQRQRNELEDDPNAALDEAAHEPAGRGRKPTEKQRAMLFAIHGELGHTDDERHRLYAAHCSGKKSFTELDAADVAKLIDVLTERR